MSRTSTRYTEECLVPSTIGGGGPTGGGNTPLTCGPTDVRCNDPEFAAANPDKCGGTLATTTLLLKPSIASAIIGNTVTFTTYMVSNGVETPLALGLTYSSSSSGIASINATTGVATGIGAGVVTINVEWHGMTAHSQLSVVATCSDITTDYVVVIDNSKSMSSVFGGSYNTKLAFAKAAAKAFVNVLDPVTNRVAVVDFNDSASTRLNFSNSIATVKSYIDSVAQSAGDTYMYGGLRSANTLLNGSSATRRVMLYVSDGENRPDPESAGDNPLSLAQAFTGAGNLLIVLGVRANGYGFTLLNGMASPGYFLNSVATYAATTLIDLVGFNGNLCAATGGYTSTSPSEQAPDPNPLSEVESNTFNPEGYSYTASYTAQCPGSDVGSPVTMSATSTSMISQNDARQKAETAARTQAFAALTCCKNPLVIGARVAAVASGDTYSSYGEAGAGTACFKVAGITDAVTSLKVKLNNLDGTSARGLTLFLEGPQGDTIKLMECCGTTGAVSHANLTLADGGSAIPTAAVITSGTYHPTLGGGCSSDLLYPLPSSAPTTTGTLLSMFNGVDPNGTWRLYGYSRSGAHTIASWSVVINEVNLCACDSAPGTLRIQDWEDSLVNTSPASLCPVCDVPLGTPTEWSGGGMVQVGSDCVWTVSGGSAVAINGRVFHNATVRLVTVSGGCYYEIGIFCTSTLYSQFPSYSGGDGSGGYFNYGNATTPRAIPFWIGRKSPTGGPVGTYTRATSMGYNPAIPICNSPGTLAASVVVEADV